MKVAGGVTHMKSMVSRSSSGLLLLMAMLFSSMSGPAGASIPEDPGPQWVARFGPAGMDYSGGLAVSPDGSKVFVIGYSFGMGRVVAYSAATGAQLRNTRFEGFPTSIGVTPDGSKVLVTGYDGSDYYTVAYVDDLRRRGWDARYDGPASGFDSAWALAVSRDGSTVFVTGSSNGVGSGSDYATVAYSAGSGAQLWVARYDGPASSIDGAKSVSVSPDGSRVFVTGYSSGVGSSFDYGTLAYSATDGSQL